MRREGEFESFGKFTESCCLTHHQTHHHLNPLNPPQTSHISLLLKPTLLKPTLLKPTLLKPTLLKPTLLKPTLPYPGIQSPPIRTTQPSSLKPAVFVACSDALLGFDAFLEAVVVGHHTPKPLVHALHFFYSVPWLLGGGGGGVKLGGGVLVG